MDHDRKINVLLVTTIVYLVGFGALAFSNGQEEPLYYISVMIFFGILIAKYHKKIDLPFHIVVGLALLAWLIPLGSNVFIKETRLFDYWIVDNLFRFDNLVHIVFGFVAVLTSYNFLGSHFSERLISQRLLLYFVLIIFAAGLGTVIEVIELIAVLTLNASKEVGSYLNNAFDLVFNIIGAGIGVYMVVPYHKGKYGKSGERKKT